MSQPVFVTGATGLVGNNVVRQLLDSGESVRILSRQSSDRRPLDGLDVEKYVGDIADAAAVKQAIAGCRAVVHAAAMVQIGWTGGEAMRKVNVEGTRHVAQAASANGARMIHVSSVDALAPGSRRQPVDETTPYAPRTPCPYAVTKRNAEIVVDGFLTQGLDAVIVHPSYMLGPWDWKPSSGRMILEVARGRTWFAPRAANDFTHVQDVAAAIVAAIERANKGDRFLLTGERISYYQAFRLMAKVTGGRAPLMAVGPVALYPAGWIGDLNAKRTGSEGDINSAAIRLLREPHYFSHEKATRVLDYHPRGLEQAVQDAWKWFVQHGYSSRS